MCVIAYKPANEELKEEWVRQCYRSNPDGAGLAIKTDDGIYIQKGFFNVEEVIRAVQLYTDKEMIVHFRKATNGSVCEANTHPFPISDSVEQLQKKMVLCNAAVAHNGVISWCVPKDEDKTNDLSDSMVFIKDYLSKVDYRNSGYIKLIENFLGRDRIAILEKGKPTLFWGAWESEGNIKFSNTSYKPYATYTMPTYGYYNPPKPAKQSAFTFTSEFTLVNAYNKCADIVTELARENILWTELFTDGTDIEITLADDESAKKFKSRYSAIICGCYVYESAGSMCM